MAPVVAEAAAQALNREVHIDQVTAFDHLGDIVVRGVAVSDAPTFRAGHGRAVAKAREVRITYDWPALLRDPANAVATVETIRIIEPAAFIEQVKPGQFNFSNLLTAQSQPSKTPFQAKVIVQNGTVIVRDDAAPKALGIQQNKLSLVNGSIDFETLGRVAYDVTARGAANRFDHARFSGATLTSSAETYPRMLQGYSVRIQLTHGNAPYLTRYFASFLGKIAPVAQGAADADITFGQHGYSKGRADDLFWPSDDP